MSSFQRVERFFSYLGAFCQIVGASLLLIVLGHYALGAAEFAKNFLETGGSEQVDVRYKSPVYDGFAEKIEYWTEFNKAWGEHFEPYYHWRRNAFAGAFINVDTEGVRVTTGSGGVARERDRTTVFMLGGSTMWGTGAPDDKTIPSILQSILGPDYEVRNYGESAYVSAQELNYLLYRLAKGDIPDAVIFYDGVNDGYAGAYSPAVPRDPHNLRTESNRGFARELLDGSNYKRLANFVSSKLNELKSQSGDRAAGSWAQKVKPDIAQNATGVVDMYEANIRQINALAREYGFKAFFFWQPNLFSLSRENTTPYERQTLDSADPVLVASQKEVYRIAKERFSGRESENIYFLGNIFDDVDEPIYIDWHHLGPNGNGIVAKEMLRLVGGAL